MKKLTLSEYLTAQCGDQHHDEILETAEFFQGCGYEYEILEGSFADFAALGYFPGCAGEECDFTKAAEKFPKMIARTIFFKADGRTELSSFYIKGIVSAKQGSYVGRVLNLRDDICEPINFDRWQFFEDE